MAPAPKPRRAASGRKAAKKTAAKGTRPVRLKASTLKTRPSVSRKSTRKKTSPAKKSNRHTPLPPPAAPETVERPSPEEEAAYTDALIKSGQAACLDEHGKLPRGATHKIVEDDAGHVSVVRRRFSIS